MAHCAACGTRLEAQPIHGRVREVCPACGTVRWENPIPAVGAVLVRDGRVLLCRRGGPPKEGGWDLPGGIMEVEEGPEDALCREVHEEIGLALERLRLIGVWPGRYDHRWSLNLIYVVEAQGEPQARDDVAATQWFPLDALPELAWEHEAEALRLLRAGGGPKTVGPTRR